MVLPAKDSAVQDWVMAQNRAAQHEVFALGQASLIASPQPMLGDTSTNPEPGWANRLIYGDNLMGGWRCW